MNIIKISSIALGILTVISCGSDKPKHIKWSVSTKNNVVKQGDNLAIQFSTFESEFDSLVVSSAGKKATFTNNTTPISWNTTKQKLGTTALKFELYANSKKYTRQGNYIVVANKSPKRYTYEVLESYAHNPISFTQGLEFDGDDFYEGTGQRGKSTLEKIELESGKSLQKHKLSDEIFGEGITIMKDKIFQLTWQAGIGYIYNKSDFSLEKTFPFGVSREGWGLCNDGKYLYKSDGTTNIYKIDPVTFQEISKIQVTSDQTAYQLINELEWVDGKIYANVYFKDEILIINPETGEVEGIIDMTNIMYPPAGKKNREEVLNGIAFKGVKNELFVTGKLWPKLFKVKVVEK